MNAFSSSNWKIKNFSGAIKLDCEMFLFHYILQSINPLTLEIVESIEKR